MRLPRVRFTVRRMMGMVVVVALFCTTDRPETLAELPRALLPTLTVGYLAWAGLDGFTAIRANGRLMGPKPILCLGAPAAVLLAGAIVHERWVFLRETAARHATLSRGCERAATEAERSGEYHVGCLVFHETDPTRLRALVDRLRQRGNYHSGLAAKYTGAAARSWLPVEPDPSEPQ